MIRFFMLCLCLLGLVPPALAQWEEPLALDDPLALRIVSTCSHQAMMLGPFDAQVSIFSVPEPDGSGHRLYVGFVEDILDRRSPSHIWRGPVAVWWEKLGPVPEYTRQLSSHNPARYRIERVDARDHNGRRASVMEINLETKPPQLRLVDPQPGQSDDADSQPLEEVLMNDSLRLIVRLDTQKPLHGSKQTLRSYRLYQGHAAPPMKRPAVIQTWEAPMDSHLLAVTSDAKPPKYHVHFLPMRPFGWELESEIFIPGWDMARANFVLQMVASYLVPTEYGGLTSLGSRHRVSVGFSGLFITTIETGLTYDVANEYWVHAKPTPKPAPKVKRKAKP